MSNRLLSTEMMKDLMRAHVASMLKQHEMFVKKGWCKSLEQHMRGALDYWTRMNWL